ncbi:MAG: hypothetical protein MZU95_01295 [Desulfomicrobium escambiense]|nr:hypothetical protein [Desulfomicrobium escambiense]
MSFLAPALLAGLLAAIAIPIVVHLVQRERRTRRGVPVADVPAQDPEPVGAAPRDPPLAAAARCASLAFALIAARVRAAVLVGRGAPAPPPGAAARSSSCSTRSAQHGLRRRAGRARRRPRGGGRQSLEPGRPRRRRRSSPATSRSARAPAAEPRRARGGRRSREPRPAPAPRAIGPALRAAAGLLEHRRPAAPGDRARLRLPEVRLGPGAGRAAARPASRSRPCRSAEAGDGQRRRGRP